MGILGNAADFQDCSIEDSNVDSSLDRRKMMIAFDMRYFMRTATQVLHSLDDVAYHKASLYFNCFQMCWIHHG